MHRGANGRMTDVYKESDPRNPLLHPPTHGAFPSHLILLSVTSVESGVNYSSAWK